MMAQGFVLALFCSLTFASLSSIFASEEKPKYPCPCSRPELCNVVPKKLDKELLIFSTVARPQNWKNYNWEKATTLAFYGEWSSELMCYAHSKGVKIVIPGYFPVANLTNTAQRMAWIEYTTERVRSLHADGVNFDIEEPVAAKSIQQKLLTKFVWETATYMRKYIPHAQITVDVPWSPDCIDNRCYDFLGLSKVADFLNIMAYDERSQVRSAKCLAGPNTAYGITLEAVKKYIRLGIPPSHLVLILPWYGYDYTCVKLSGDECYIRHYDQFGVNCSDAVAHERDISEIEHDFVSLAQGGVRYDNVSQSLFFNYHNSKDNKMHQMWFDNPKTLSAKYNNDVTEYLKGKSMFTADCLYYGDDEERMKRTKATWKSIYH